MSITLKKGQKISLSKEVKGLSKVMVGLGWDEVERSGGFLIFRPADIDCDASAILCNASGKLIGSTFNDSCVYYGNLRHDSGAIIHQGDNLTGEGEGDDEQIMVNLDKVPEICKKIVFVVNIYEANVRNQHFGMIKNAFIRLVDLDSDKEICRYNLTEKYDGMTGLIVGEVFYDDGEWQFNAIDKPIKEASSLSSIVNLYK